MTDKAPSEARQARISRADEETLLGVAIFLAGDDLTALGISQGTTAVRYWIEGDQIRVKPATGDSN